MISVDRYYAITKPLEYGVKRTPRRMIACVSLVWLGAACISLPPLLILGNEHGQTEPGMSQQCVVCQNFGYQIYATLGSFYIPLTVMIVVYYKIFRAARRIVLEERKAQSHLETHSYLEISVRNGGGPPETRVASTTSSPAVASAARVQHHRTSTTSTITTVSRKLQHLPKSFIDHKNYVTASYCKLNCNSFYSPALSPFSGQYKRNDALDQSRLESKYSVVVENVALHSLFFTINNFHFLVIVKCAEMGQMWQFAGDRGASKETSAARNVVTSVMQFV
jgi:hypothetical protein